MPTSNDIHVATNLVSYIHRIQLNICTYIYMYIYIYILICYNTDSREAFDIYIRITPKGPRESADISIKPQARPCYNIYVTPPNLLCSMCSARSVVFAP